MEYIQSVYTNMDRITWNEEFSQCEYGSRNILIGIIK